MRLAPVLCALVVGELCVCGRAQNSTNSTQPIFVADNKTSDCPVGSFGLSNQTLGCSTCEGCPAGTFRNKCGGQNSGTCDLCPTGKYKSFSGTGECEGCGSCWPGHMRIDCNFSNPGTCEDCPVGTFKLSWGLGECKSCDCDAGLYRPSCGGDSALLCRPCPSGEFKAFAGSSRCLPCLSCAPGEYREGCGGMEEGVCRPCPANASAASGSVDEERCSRCGAGCPPGTQREGCGLFHDGACAACPTDTYKREEGPAQCSRCQGCAPGTYRSKCGGASEGTCKQVEAKLEATVELDGVGVSQFEGGEEIFRAEVARMLAETPGEERRSPAHVEVTRAERMPSWGGGVQAVGVDMKVVGFALSATDELEEAAAALNARRLELLAGLQQHTAFASLVDVRIEVHPWAVFGPQDAESESSSSGSARLITAAAITAQVVILMAVCATAVWKRRVDSAAQLAALHAANHPPPCETNHPLGILVIANQRASCTPTEEEASADAGGLAPPERRSFDC